MNKELRFNDVISSLKEPLADVEALEVLEDEVVSQAVLPPETSGVKKETSRSLKGKSSNPEYTQTSVYVKRTTYNNIKRKLLDENVEGTGRDYSDLVEELLTIWLRGERGGLGV